MASSRKERISLLALQDDGKGLGCPKCGCKQWRVRDTVPVAEEIRRYRVCRNCGHILTTLEVPASQVKQARKNEES